MLPQRSIRYGAQRWAALLLLLLAVPCTGREIYEGRWLEARSPAFVVYSTLDAEATVEAAQQLEDFGQLITLFTTIGSTKARVPTYVFIFKDANASVGFGRDIGGRFLPTMRANYATARRQTGLGLTRVLQHEYAHFLLHNNNGQRYPRWFDEGFAELASTATIDKGKFTFGNVDKNRAQWLIYGPWLSYKKLLDPAENSRFNQRQTAMFYAQSWALDHYLMMGPNAKEFPARMANYLQRVERGENEVAAFEKAFDVNSGKLETAVRRYLERMKMFGGKLTKPFDQSEVSIRQLPSDEVAAAMGVLALHVGQSADSERYFRAALALNSRNSEALVGSADHLKFAGKFAEAEPLYQQAIDIAPGSSNHRLDFGEYWLDRAAAAKDPSDVDALLRRARQEFVVAHKLDESNPETLAMYGSSFLLGNSDPAKGLDTLELAGDLLPSNPTIKWSLARLYMALKRPKDARPLVQALIAWSHDGRAPDAEKLLAEIDGRALPPPVEEDPQSGP